eukprot:GSChrysophyteH1.ASY1.ANO1.805.1 assembled CDS
MATPEKKKDIYTYRAPWTAYTMSWCSKPGPENLFKIAVGSYKEEYSNRMSIIQLKDSENSSKDEVDRKFVELCEVEHPYPATKIMWAPAEKDLIASTGDYLRIWNVRTCSIDTTCTIWDINVKEAKTQLIAHDREVYDIAFACGTNVFGTVGADGSLRTFDLRSLKHSTILYESPELQPLMRLVWNKQDPHYVATVSVNSDKAIILDIRVPSTPVATLSGSDDKQALIWDTATAANVQDPILAYSAAGEINNVQWRASHQDWVGITYGNEVQVLRV